MECPVCGEKMREIEKYGVMVDICPGCKGVWLDRGELEKVAGLEARGAFDERAEDDHTRDRERHDRGSERRDDDHARRYNDDPHRPASKRRSSFLTDLLEGFGGE